MADQSSKKGWTVAALVGGLLLAIAILSSLDSGSGVSQGVPGLDTGTAPGISPVPGGPVAPNPPPQVAIAPTTGAATPVAPVLAPGDDPPADAGAAPSPTAPPTKGSAAHTRSKLDLAYLPPDSQVIIRVKVASLWESPFVQAFAETAQIKSQLAQTLQARIGLSPSDIDSVTIGSPGIFGRGAPNDPYGLDPAKLFIAVVRTNNVTPELLKLRENGGEPVKRESTTYYRLPAFPGQTDKQAVFLPSPSVIVFGEEIALQAAIERGTKAFRRPELDFVDSDQQLVVAVVPRDKSALFAPTVRVSAPKVDPDDPIEAPSPPPPLETGITRFKEAMIKYSSGFSLAVNCGEGLDLRILIEAVHADGARRLKQGLAPAVTDARVEFKQMQAALPLPLIHLIDKLFTSLKVAEQGKLVTLSCSLTGPARRDLEELAKALKPALGGNFVGMAADSRHAELAGVPPETTEGIPEGLTLKAKGCWLGESGSSDAKNRKSNRLEVLIDLGGDLATEVIAYGLLKLNTITADSDKSLKLLKLPAAFGEDPTTQWVMVDRNDPAAAHPDDGVRIRCFIERPKQSITKITDFEGEFQLRTAEATLDKEVENANQYIGKSVPDPELLAAGFLLKLNEGKELVATVNKDLLLGKLHAFDASDKPIPNTFCMSGELKGALSQSIVFASGKVPPNLTLQFALYGGLKMVRVPFKFKDLPIEEASSQAPGGSSSGDDLNLTQRALNSSNRRGAATVPFGVDSAKVRPGQERSDNELQMKFCWCPPGPFTIGSPKSEDGRDHDEAQAKVVLTRGFWMGKYEVTQKDWQTVMATQPWNGKPLVKVGPAYPATFVSWDDATSFCKKLTEQERKAGRLPAGWEYRLPTETQWEYACRAGSKARFTFGESPARLPEFAWFHNNTTGEEYPHEVGKKKANAWKLHDVHGNVWEWCLDGYAEKHPSGADPQSPNASDHVAHGGSYTRSVRQVRAAARIKFPTPERNVTLGFRVAAVQTGR